MKVQPWSSPVVSVDEANKKRKYVNMADINTRPISGHAENAALDDDQALALVELMFFAYRDFVGDADAMLAELDFGRAHHRVLHFVGRNPGMTVAQLLDILQITKQSLSRVLKELIEKDLIYQKEGEIDRRQRLLYLTENGNQLWRKLVEPQKRRFTEAVKDNHHSASADMRDMLLRLINSENREGVSAWLKKVNS
jgi:DNA-binding MarR family transcriptional regulator